MHDATKRAAEDSPDRLLWTAGIAAGASLPHWLTLPIWVPGLLCVSIAWRLGGARFGWPLPNTFARVAFALLSFAAVLIQYQTINGLEAGTALLIVMVALKFLESRTARDQLVLIIIAYFLLFASLLVDRGVAMVAYLLGFVWFTTVGLLQLGRRGPLLRNLDTAKQAGWLLLQAMPIMLILFVLFPRLPGPLWGIPGADSRGRSGLSDTMSPGDLTELGLSDDVAFRVEFFARPPGPDRLYWRGPVLSVFNGRTWSSDGPGVRPGMVDTLELSGDPIDYRVMLEPHDRRWVFALDMPIKWSEDLDIRMENHYQLVRTRRPIRSRFDYEVTSYPQYRTLEELNERTREYYLRLPPEGNPQSRALAQRWRDESSSEREIITKALSIFRAEQFYYTLTPPPLGANTADEFLFQTREGFCEHYSSAFTILMRAAGIPARIVTGYQGGELNPLGEYYIIYQSNAHAWTEVWLDGEGWVRVDPTAAVAPDRITSGLSGRSLAGEQARRGAFQNLPWIRQTLLAWDAAQTYWNAWVIGYGPDLQRALLEALGISRPHWSKLVALAAGAVLLVSGLLTIYLSWSFGRIRKRDRAAALFERFCRRLERARVSPRRASEGPLDFGNRASTALPMQADEIQAITRAYLQSRYGPNTGGAGLETLQRLVRGFRPVGAN
jgi:transglutaminase-like putative cysteine protease